MRIGGAGVGPSAEVAPMAQRTAIASMASSLSLRRRRVRGGRRRRVPRGLLRRILQVGVGLEREVRFPRLAGAASELEEDLPASQGQTAQEEGGVDLAQP